MSPAFSPPLSIIALLLACLLQGCATPASVPDPLLDPLPDPLRDPGAPLEQQRIDELEQAILELSDEIDPGEAHNAATIAIEYPLQLALEYEITDSPLMHNFLVNMGVKPRGLCVDWTYDLLVRLQQERFRSLKLHWGIANYDSAFRIEHSTVIISVRNQPLQKGLVLDPWRHSGRLFWAKTREDPVYRWKPHAEVHAQKRERKALAQKRTATR
jgi:hypothetical protein